MTFAIHSTDFHQVKWYLIIAIKRYYFIVIAINNDFQGGCWVPNHIWNNGIVFIMRMVTSSNGTFSALLPLCEKNQPVTGWFSSQSPMAWGFDVFFILYLNKRLTKQSNRHVGDLRPHRTHYDVTVMRKSSMNRDTYFCMFHDRFVWCQSFRLQRIRFWCFDNVRW